MLENLKHAVWSNKTVTIAGGEFSPREVKAFCDECERNASIAELAKKYAESHWSERAAVLATIREALES